jgi:hypothetical protein
VKPERKLEASKAVHRDRLISNQRRRQSSNNVGEEAVHRWSDSIGHVSSPDLI